MAAATAHLLPLLLVLTRATLHQAVAAHAMHESFKDDPRPLIFLGKFRFSRNGSVSIAATAGGEADMTGPFLAGFFLLPDGMRLDQVIKKTRTPTYRRCILSSPYVVRLVTFAALDGDADGRYKVGTFPITRAGEYSLYFANCVPGTRVTMDVRVELSDSNPDGGDDPVAVVYAFFTVCYGVFLIAWLHRTLVRSYSTARPVHDVMSGLLAVLMLHCLTAAYDWRYTSVFVTAHGRNVPCLALRLVKNAMLFPVVALIGAGWSLPEPFVPDRELNVLTAVAPLQVAMVIASTLIGDAPAFIAGGVYWTWSHVFVLVQLACCVAVLMPMDRAIQALRKEADSDDKAAQRLRKLALFRQLYFAVAMYLYYTRMAVFILKLLVGAGSGYRWASVAVEEAAAVAFYLFMFCEFSPVEDIQLEEDAEELIPGGV